MPTTADDRATLAELRPGAELRGVFACTRKDRLTARTGSPYLALELRDRTGAVPARAFREADFLAAQFEQGDLVEVEGRAERFRDELVVDLRSVKRADPAGVDPADFLPVAYRDLDELDGFLEHLGREVYDRRLRGPARLLPRGRRPSAPRCAGRRARATATTPTSGGLLEHTVAVATLAQETCILHPRLDSDLLICAALLHDIGKTREFTLGAEIALSEEGALLGHLALGQQMLLERGAGVPRERLLALVHCVLGHHGPDNLPGRRFRSPEALALARLNSLDAQVKGALEHGLPG